ncbi:MAG TPA: hypothetical protein DCG57_21700 [Candidatus Riflebacteria bacterium]|jgi:putative phosphoesterase|nr:hypothetical protein [Candidatus Riflebacteria bacterium]
MKIAVISDIHGNFVALEAVLKDVKERGCDRLVCLGDLATLGPQPVQVLEAVMEENCDCIMGNHDQALLSPDKWNELQIYSMVQPDLKWAMQHLDDRHYKFLSSFLPYKAVAMHDNYQILFCHGSPKSNIQVMFPDMDVEMLDEMCDGFSAQAIVNGHLHCQFRELVGKRLYINPGSVGMPFKIPPGPGIAPVMHHWAEYATLFISPSGKTLAEKIQVELHRVNYDFSELKQILNASSLPGKSWWLEQMP